MNKALLILRPTAICLLGAFALYLGLPWLVGVAHGAATADPIVTVQAATDGGMNAIAQYGPYWGGGLLAFTIGHWFLKRNETTNWLSQGKTLATLTTAAMLLGAVLQWKLGDGDTAGLLMSLFLAVKMLISPTVASTPAQDKADQAKADQAKADQAKAVAQ